MAALESPTINVISPRMFRPEIARAVQNKHLIDILSTKEPSTTSPFKAGLRTTLEELEAVVCGKPIENTPITISLLFRDMEHIEAPFNLILTADEALKQCVAIPVHKPRVLGDELVLGRVTHVPSIQDLSQQLRLATDAAVFPYTITMGTPWRHWGQPQYPTTPIERERLKNHDLALYNELSHITGDT